MGRSWNPTRVKCLFFFVFFHRTRGKYWVNNALKILIMISVWVTHNIILYPWCRFTIFKSAEILYWINNVWSQSITLAVEYSYSGYWRRIFGNISLNFSFIVYIYIYEGLKQSNGSENQSYILCLSGCKVFIFEIKHKARSS